MKTKYLSALFTCFDHVHICMNEFLSGFNTSICWSLGDLNFLVAKPRSNWKYVCPLFRTQESLE